MSPRRTSAEQRRCGSHLACTSLEDWRDKKALIWATWYAMSYDAMLCHATKHDAGVMLVW